MGKQSFITSLLFTLTVTVLAHSHGFPNPQLGIQKVTQLQVYVQDIISGPNPSNIVVAVPTTMRPNLFGIVAAIDDPIRVSPDPDAEIVGRAQGLFNFASLEETRLHMSFDMVFTGGQYNGSILNVIGNNPYLRDRRELAVVGGAGYFKVARGFIGIRTVSFNATTGDAFFEYNVTVYHH